MNYAKESPLMVKRGRLDKLQPPFMDFVGETKEETEKTSQSESSQIYSLFNPCSSPTPLRRHDADNNLQVEVSQSMICSMNDLNEELSANIVSAELEYNYPQAISQEFTFLELMSEMEHETGSMKGTLPNKRRTNGSKIQHLPSSSISSSIPSLSGKNESLKFKPSKTGTIIFNEETFLKKKNENLDYSGDPNEPTLDYNKGVAKSHHDFTNYAQSVSLKLKKVFFFFEHYSDAGELLNVKKTLQSLETNFKKADEAYTNFLEFEKKADEKKIFVNIKGETKCLEIIEEMEIILSNEEFINKTLSFRVSSLQNYKAFMKKFGIDKLVANEPGEHNRKQCHRELDSLLEQLPRMIYEFSTLHHSDDNNFKNIQKIDSENTKRTLNRYKSCHIQTSDYYNFFNESQLNRSTDFKTKVEFLERFAEGFMVAYSKEAHFVLEKLIEQLLKVRVTFKKNREIIKFLIFCVKDIRLIRSLRADILNDEADFLKRCDEKLNTKTDYLYLEAVFRKFYQSALLREQSIKKLQELEDVTFFKKQKINYLKKLGKRNLNLIKMIKDKNIENFEKKIVNQLDSLRKKIKKYLEQIKTTLSFEAYSEDKIQLLIAPLTKTLNKTENCLTEAEDEGLLEARRPLSFISVQKSIEIYLFISFKYIAAIRLVLLLSREGLIETRTLKGCRAYLDLCELSIYAEDIYLNQEVTMEYLGEFKSKFLMNLSECHSIFAELDSRLKGLPEWENHLLMFESCKKKIEFIQTIFDFAVVEKSYSAENLKKVFLSIKLFDSSKTVKLIGDLMTKLINYVQEMGNWKQIPMVGRIIVTLNSRLDTLAIILKNIQNIEELIRGQQKVEALKSKLKTVLFLLGEKSSDNLIIVDFYEKTMLSQVAKLSHLICPIEYTVTAMKNLVDEVENRFELFKGERLNFDRVVSSLTRLENIEQIFKEKVLFLQSLSVKHYPSRELEVAARGYILSQRHFEKIIETMILIVREVRYLKYELSENILNIWTFELEQNLENIILKLENRTEAFKMATRKLDFQGNLLDVMYSLISVFYEIKNEYLHSKELLRYLSKTDLKIYLFDKEWKGKFKLFIEQGFRLKEKKYPVLESLDQIIETTGLKYLEGISVKFIEFMSKEYRPLNLVNLLSIHDNIIHIKKDDLLLSIKLVLFIKELCCKAKDCYIVIKEKKNEEYMSGTEVDSSDEELSSEGDLDVSLRALNVGKLVEIEGALVEKKACIDIIMEKMKEFNKHFLNFNFRYTKIQNAVQAERKTLSSIFCEVGDLAEAKKLIEEHSLKKWMHIFYLILQILDEEKLRDSLYDKKVYVSNLLRETSRKVKKDLREGFINFEVYHFFLDFSALYIT